MKFSHILRDGPRRVGVLRAFVAMVAGCCLVATAGPGVAEGARTLTVDLHCFASAQFNFTPPLNFNTTHASEQGLLSSCASPNGQYPRIKSGVIFASDVLASGCWPAPFRLSGPNSTIVWSDGSSSTFALAISTDPTSGNLGLNGYVTDGPLVGGHAVAVPVAVAQRGVCLLGGVSSMSVTFSSVAVTHMAITHATTQRRREWRG